MILLNKLSYPPTYMSRHDSIVDAKRNVVIKAQLQTLKSAISNRYNVFERHVTSRTIEMISEDVLMRTNKDELHSCYKNKTKKTIEIFSKIEQAQNNRVLERCPYCGITLPKTYDHYLPAEKFPEFSVHAVNLVPCCNDCNSIKGDRWIKDGKRLFIHFYSDTLPTDHFLFVRLNTKPNSLAYGVKFSLSLAPPMNYTVNDWDLIKSHYQKLSLLKKYQDYSNNEISNAFSLCAAHIKGGGRTVEEFLNYYCDDEELIFGVNHWRTVLKRALASSVDFQNNVVNSVAAP